MNYFEENKEIINLDKKINAEIELIYEIKLFN